MSAKLSKDVRDAIASRNGLLAGQREEIETLRGDVATLRCECQRLIDCNARLCALLHEAAARFDRTPDGEWRRAVRAELGDENA